ncbi:MAG: MazG family protein [Bifidobacteriaceae bacterium]|jgi:XTP/dITP diphosphohydrolase|nr:MazG family protein [Bifidobacteriaceae bacterium]
MTVQPSAEPESKAGGQVYRLVGVMDQLRAPDGCPWDGEQDHASLIQYLLEEAYEVADAIETSDRAALREELGDVLLQVVFHAAIAKAAAEPFDLDDIASDVADKLIRRHPHVFTDDAAPHLTAEQSYARWDRIKAREKARTSVLDGIPNTQGALARTQKVIGRAKRGGFDIHALTGPLLTPSQEAGGSQADEVRDGIGGKLLAAIVEAEDLGIEAEGALRATMRRLESAIRTEEGRPEPPGRESTPQSPGQAPARGNHTTRR